MKVATPPLWSSAMTVERRDEEAWRLAIEMQRARGPDRAKQIDGMLRERGFESAGKFASYSQQCDNLRLRPWATPPCHLLEDVDVVLARGDDGMPGGDHVAALLLKKMRDAGISDRHPDPMAALAEAAKKSGAAA